MPGFSDIDYYEQADTGFLPRLNLKAFNFFNTCLHGWWTSNVTTFGMPVGLAATFDEELMRDVGEVVGAESRALSQRDYNISYDFGTGYHGVFINWLVCKDASEVNMNRHPLWGRNPETYGEDPFLTGIMGQAFTQQLQKPTPSKSNSSRTYLRTAAVTRHLVITLQLYFLNMLCITSKVVYSGPESLGDDNKQGANRFKFNANVSERDLEDYFYPPFQMTLSASLGASAGAMVLDSYVDIIFIFWSQTLSILIVEE